MPGIHLILQYVNDRRAERQAEYDECLRRNLANPRVTAVHELQEHAGVVVPDEFARHPKFKRFALGKWLTFRDAFEHANRELAGEVCGLLNLDIFVDPAIDYDKLAMATAQRIVFCLSRTEFESEANVYRDPGLLSVAFANSQDAWFFRAPIHVERCDFELGTLGCDNAIADRIRRSGYLPVNAPQQFRVFHYDRARGKTLANQKEILREERAGRGQSARPEEEGQYLLPDFDMIRSVDELLAQFKASELERYALICDVFSRHLKARNP